VNLTLYFRFYFGSCCNLGSSGASTESSSTPTAPASDISGTSQLYIPYEPSAASLDNQLEIVTLPSASSTTVPLTSSTSDEDAAISSTLANETGPTTENQENTALIGDATTSRLEGVEQSSPTLPVTELLDSQDVEGSTVNSKEEQNSISDDDPADDDVAAATGVDDESGSDVPSLEGDMAAVVSEIMDKLESPEPQSTMIKEGLLTPPVQILEISTPEGAAVSQDNQVDTIGTSSLAPETLTQQMSLATETGSSEALPSEMKTSSDSNPTAVTASYPTGEHATDSNSGAELATAPSPGGELATAPSPAGELATAPSPAGELATNSPVAPEQPAGDPVASTQGQPDENSQISQPLNTEMPAGMSDMAANVPKDGAGEPLTPPSLELISNQIIIDGAIAPAVAATPETTSTASSDLASRVSDEPLPNGVTESASIASAETGATASIEPLGISVQPNSDSDSASNISDSALPIVEVSITSKPFDTISSEEPVPMAEKSASESPSPSVPDTGVTNAPVELTADGAGTVSDTPVQGAAVSSAPEELVSSSSESAVPTAPEVEVPTSSETAIPAAPESVVSTVPEVSVSNAPDAAVPSVSEGPVPSAPEAPESSAYEATVSSAPAVSEPSASETAVSTAPEAVPSSSEVAVPSAPEAAVTSTSETALTSSSEAPVPSATEAPGAVVASAGSTQDSQQENSTTGAILSPESAPATPDDTSSKEDSLLETINLGRRKCL
jgi:hypothetical protein